MSAPPLFDDPEVVRRDLTKLFLRLSEDPSDLRRTLEGLGEALSLIATQIPLAERGDARLVWNREPEEQ